VTATASATAATTTTTSSTIESQDATQSDNATSGAPDPVAQKAQADKLIAEGKKAIALKQWEDGVGRYADALDIM
jgi:HAT1-interacting factor 1